jgi:hypothetical protein
VVGDPLLVIKTSLYLEPEVDRALARRAADVGVTKAELIRRALAEAVVGAERARPAARGVFEGPGDLGRGAEDHLRRSRFGER